ncbi:MAG: ASPIC/UnbV domain-containing protein, partial [Planctomycetaceae bacterium]|nr:ASPIC/UnbV domain-containing protein [Planctomycetaceae bacterium]
IGHFLNVRLHARRTARDAFGALATVLTGSAAISKQLNPGNGYMASNERLLQFGLGPLDRVPQMEVRWPSGEVTTLVDVPVDVTVELVEGAKHAVVWDAKTGAARRWSVEETARESRPNSVPHGRIHLDRSVSVRREYSNWFPVHTPSPDARQNVVRSTHRASHAGTADSHPSKGD